MKKNNFFVQDTKLLDEFKEYNSFVEDDTNEYYTYFHSGKRKRSLKNFIPTENFKNFMEKLFPGKEIRYQILKFENLTENEFNGLCKHTDVTRQCLAFNYVLKSGNKNGVITGFYELGSIFEKNYKNYWQYPRPFGVKHEHLLNVGDMIQKENTWCILDSGLYHDVREIEPLSYRELVSVGIIGKSIFDLEKDGIQF